MSEDSDEFPGRLLHQVSLSQPQLTILPLTVEILLKINLV